MEKGFWGSIFDFSFSSFVTPKLIKILYIVTLVLLAIGYVAIAIAIFASGGTELDPETFETTSSSNTGLGIAWLVIFGPLALFIYTLLYRVFFELLIVLFRIYESTRDELALTRLINPGAAAELDAMVHEPHVATPPPQAPAAPPTPPAPPAPPAG